jgi:hypothetical protein
MQTQRDPIRSHGKNSDGGELGEAERAAPRSQIGRGGSRRLVAVLTVVLMAGICGTGNAATPDEAGNAFFEKNIRPILVERCDQCHSANSKKIRGGLTLDHREAWLKGGDSGPAIEPGKPEESLVVLAVRYEEDGMKMPPKGKLPDREIALLTEWVAMGAPDPRSETAAAPAKPLAAVDMDEARRFWAFVPPADPPVPAVKDTSWPQSPLDRFILAALEENGLVPAPPADKRTLIRRATFDLIGLPPTPAEIDAFLADDSPDAFAKVVDRLLASPHYGERWGRHWLDVARYADSNGLDENIAYGNAWRYRDYVVEAFNRDKPYDRFVSEQVAGDLLPDEYEGGTHERLIATGFLALGPKVLAEPDKVKMEMDIVDEQIDTFGRVFMGLTLGCARCHDHKFDPISTADYYALAGVFRSTLTMDSFATVARLHEISLASPEDEARLAAHKGQVAEQKQAIDALVQRSAEALKASSPPDFVVPKDPEPLFPDETKTELKRLREALAALEKAAPEMPIAMGVAEGKVADTQIHIRGSHLSLGEEVHRRVPVVLASTTPPSFQETQSGRLQLAQWLSAPEHPLTSRVMVNRLWRWHFGKGIVATPDNFGLLGSPPSNPALLDWLAARFVGSGWSIKEMHRIIMCSSVYQMSSQFDAAAAEADPENLLSWRFPPRRLEAEAIRDSLLAVSGRLDLSMGGSLLTVKDRDYLFNHTSQDHSQYDTSRRSIYVPIVRNHMYDLFELFDYADAGVSNGDRAVTTVAPQALFMMNSELVERTALDLASSLAAVGSVDDAERTRRLYDRLYGRLPTVEETARAAVFRDRFAQGIAAADPAASPAEINLRAWQALCQTLLASNEFVYVD